MKFMITGGEEKIFINLLVEPLETVEDNSKAKELLNWEPTNSVDSWIKKIKKDWRI